MDLSIFTPDLNKTVKDRYDSLVEAGIYFRLYDGESYDPNNVLNYIQEKYRINLIHFLKRERKFKKGGIERVIGILPSCVDEGWLYNDLLSNKNALQIRSDLNKSLRVSLFGEIYFLDTRIKNKETLKEFGLPSINGFNRAGFFVLPGLKYIKQFDSKDNVESKGNFLKTFFNVDCECVQ